MIAQRFPQLPTRDSASADEPHEPPAQEYGRGQVLHRIANPRICGVASALGYGLCPEAQAPSPSNEPLTPEVMQRKATAFVGYWDAHSLFTPKVRDAIALVRSVYESPGNQGPAKIADLNARVEAILLAPDRQPKLSKRNLEQYVTPETPPSLRGYSALWYVIRRMTWDRADIHEFQRAMGVVDVKR